MVQLRRTLTSVKLMEFGIAFPCTIDAPTRVTSRPNHWDVKDARLAFEAGSSLLARVTPGPMAEPVRETLGRLPPVDL
jgi:hypothetical protein